MEGTVWKQKDGNKINQIGGMMEDVKSFIVVIVHSYYNSAAAGRSDTPADPVNVITYREQVIF